MKRMAAVLLFIGSALNLWMTPTSRARETAVTVGRERHVIPGYIEPNTPGAPGVTVDPALEAAITDPAAKPNGKLNLNQAIYVRFFDRTRTDPPTTIIIMVPSAVAGVNTLNVLAPDLVTRSGGAFEVWAVDRRSNLLENLEALRIAESNPTVDSVNRAIDAYYNDPAGRGGYIHAHPFSLNSFMAEWGLDVHLRDLKVIVETARALRTSSGVRPRIILGGGTFGAFLVEQFAAYNFEGTAGFTLIDAMLLLDGTIAPGISPFNPTPDNQYLGGGPGPLGPAPGLNNLRSPVNAPLDDGFTVTSTFNPLNFALAEAAAQLALIDPNGSSPLSQLVPNLVPVPATNAASLAINLDDEFQPATFARFSIGFLKVPPGGQVTTVASKVSPDPTVPQPNGNPNGAWTPKNLGATLQQWDPATSLVPIGLKGIEPTDFNTLMRALLQGNGDRMAQPGEANFLEWYFPQRLVIDIFKAILDTSSLSTPIKNAMTARGGKVLAVTENKRVNVPTLGMRAEEGFLQSPIPGISGVIAFSVYRGGTNISANNFVIVNVPGYCAGDLLTTTDGTTSKAILDFLSTKVPQPVN